MKTKARTRFPMVSDPKQRGLYWQKRLNGTEAAVWRQIVNGRSRWKVLGQIDREAARKLIRESIKTEGALALAKRLGLYNEEGPVSRVRDLFDAYKKFVPTARGLDAETAKRNKAAFKRILLTVHGEGFDVENASLEVFNVRLLRKYEELKTEEANNLAKAVNLDVEEMEKRRETSWRTVQSTVRQARSLFSEKAMQSSAYEDLIMPDCIEAAKKVVVGISTLVDYVPLDEKVVERIRRAAGKLKKEDAGAWLVLKLCSNSGMRRSSVVHAKRDWFGARCRDKNGNECVELNVKVAKGRRSTPLFPLDVYEEIEPFFGEEYLIPFEAAEDQKDVAKRQRIELARRDGAAVRLGFWLREQGLDDRKHPVHELRKIFGDNLNRIAGAEEVQRQLGHTDMRTGQAYRKNKGTVSGKVL